MKLIHSQIMDFQVNHPPALEKAVGIWLKVSVAGLKRQRPSLCHSHLDNLGIAADLHKCLGAPCRAQIQAGTIMLC